MVTRVAIGGWEHECCGHTIRREEVVQLTCVPPDGSPARTDFLFSPHYNSWPAYVVSGRVQDIELVDREGRSTSIDRVPSGAALRGFDDHDDGIPHEHPSGETLSDQRGTYLVSLLSATVSQVDESGWNASLPPANSEETTSSPEYVGFDGLDGLPSRSADDPGPDRVLRFQRYPIMPERPDTDR